MNNFYKLTQNVRELGVCNFALADYNVVYGDFITGIQYIKDDKIPATIANISTAAIIRITVL